MKTGHELFHKFENLANDLAHKTARKTGLDFKELQATAFLSLCKAIKTHNKDRGQLSTYAYHIIHNDLKTTVDKTFSHTPHEGTEIIGEFNVQRQIEFQDSLRKIGKEAKFVCDIIFAGPCEVLGIAWDSSPCKIRKEIRKLLEKKGKSKQEIRLIFSEITEILN